MNILNVATNGNNSIFRKCILEALKGFSPFNEYRVIFEVYGHRNIAEIKYTDLLENEYKELLTRFRLGINTARSLSRGGNI